MQSVESLGITWSSIIIVTNFTLLNYFASEGIIWFDIDNDGVDDLFICERKDTSLGCNYIASLSELGIYTE